MVHKLIGWGPRRKLQIAMRTNLPFRDAKRCLIGSFERTYVSELLQRHGGNLSAASRDASLSRKHLRALLRKHDLHRVLAKHLLTKKL